MVASRESSNIRTSPARSPRWASRTRIPDQDARSADRRAGAAAGAGGGRRPPRRSHRGGRAEPARPQRRQRRLLRRPPAAPVRSGLRGGRAARRRLARLSLRRRPRRLEIGLPRRAGRSRARALSPAAGRRRARARRGCRDRGNRRVGARRLEGAGAAGGPRARTRRHRNGRQARSAGGGFTVCIDPVWGEPLARALRFARPHARIVHLGQAAGAEAPLRSADVRGKELAILGHSNFALTKEERDRAYLELLDHLAAGRMTLEYQTFSLDDVAAAWQNQRGGKSVVLL